MLKPLVAMAVLFLVAAGAHWLRLHASPRVRAHVPLSDGVLVLRPPRGQRIMLGLGALVPAAVLGALGARVWAAGTGTAGRVAVAAAALLALAVALHQFLSAFRQRFVAHLAGLQCIGVATRREVRWSSVASVAYNPMHHRFFVTSADGSHVWIPEDLHGIGDFAALALRRLPPAALAADPLAREELEDLAAAARAATG